MESSFAGGRGIYDRDWGVIVAARRDAAYAAFFEQVRTELDCDGVVDAAVIAVESGAHEGWALWDHRRVLVGYGAYGAVPAVSIEIVIRDAPEREVYFGVGGVQLVTRVETDKFTEPHFEPIPTEEVLADSREANEAIRLALDELRTALQGPKPRKREGRGERSGPSRLSRSRSSGQARARPARRTEPAG